MISDYMEDLEIENPFSHLKPWQKTPYEKQHGRNIYKNAQGKYYICKRKDNVLTNYGTFKTFQEALEHRDELIRNGWANTRTENQKIKKYYANIHINGKQYYITHNGKYQGCTKTLEEALYYRDICKEHNWQYPVRPKDMDLKKDNPYIHNGFCYPIPERLIMPEDNGEPKKLGCISSNGKQSHAVLHGSDYFGCYRTYEMAWYVREELNKCGFDKDKLDEIVEGYPVWYTWLMHLYKFVIPDGDAWLVSLTPKNSGNDKLERIRFHRLEDALWERDLLVKYGFDEELLVECADDSLNPYYDMELPPYPQRKIRNISGRKDRTDLFNKLYELIQSEEDYSQEDYCMLAGTTSAGLRLILKNEYDTDWSEFKNICESGENPNDVLVQKPKIYKPDLKLYHNNTNYVSYHKKQKSPYLIYHRNKETQQSEYFGAYPTRELANKISDDLQACGWDKSKLKEIQAKHGWVSVPGSKRWISTKYYTSKKTGETYVQHYQIRNKKYGSFGCYKDKRVAELIRDLLVLHNWNKDFLQTIREFSFYCISQLDHNWRCQLKWLGK